MRIETVEGCTDYKINDGVMPIGFAVLKRLEKEGAFRVWRDTILLLFNPNMESTDVLSAHNAQNPGDKMLARGTYKYIPGVDSKKITDATGNLVSPSERWYISYAEPMNYLMAEHMKETAVRLIRRCIEALKREQVDGKTAKDADIIPLNIKSHGAKHHDREGATVMPAAIAL